MTTLQKIAKGQSALKIYFQQSSRFANWKFKTFADLLEHVRTLNPRNEEFLGNAIGETSAADAANVMKNLAEEHRGTFPAKFSTLMRPFSNPELLEQYGLWTDLKNFASAVPSGIGDTAEFIADSAKTGLRFGSFLVPLAVAIAVGVLIFQKGGGKSFDLKKVFR